MVSNEFMETFRKEREQARMKMEAKHEKMMRVTCCIGLVCNFITILSLIYILITVLEYGGMLK